MLTPRMQAQAIANAISGRGLMTDERGWEEHLKPRDFTDPWKEAAFAVSQAESGQERQALLNALKDHPDRDSILAEIWAVEPPPQFPTFAELGERLPPITWLWKNWIPRRLLSLLGSISGAGKSYLALDLARRIVEGTIWPDGTPVITSEDATVIYVDAERIPRVHYDRLKAWGTDSSRIYPLAADMLPDDHPDIIDFSNSEDQYILIEMANRVRPDLIIVDSMGSISTRGENNIEDVREVLSFLVAMAMDFGCGCLLLHHLRKRLSGAQMSGILAIDDFRGSGHITQMSRSVLALSAATDGSGRVDRNATRRLEVVKTNLVRYPEALGIDFVPIPGNEEFAILETTDAPEILVGGELTQGDECMIWLMNLLQDAGESIRPKEIVEMGLEEGFERRMIYRQRKRLGDRVMDTEHSKHPNNRWVWND